LQVVSSSKEWRYRFAPNVAAVPTTADVGIAQITSSKGSKVDAASALRSRKLFDLATHIGHQ
jgi:hypothetical protein